MSHRTGPTRIRRTVVAAASALTLGAGGAAWAATSASAASAPAATPNCATSSLSVWVDANQGDGAAGTDALALEFTNRGPHVCTLRGYPGVSAANLDGTQLGDAARRQPVFKAATVTIPAGGTVHADLFYGEVEVSTSGCKPTSASLIKVYPPNSKTSKTAFFSLKACTLKGHGYLAISVIRPGSKLDV